MLLLKAPVVRGRTEMLIWPAAFAFPTPLPAFVFSVTSTQALPSPTSEIQTPDKPAAAAAKSEATFVPVGMPKRSRSPVAELTLPPPARCDDEVSRDLEVRQR